ncbi:MAG: YggS family pyridoxal phosphate-dependent enzyme [Candidatus Wenzhouxiangella sp. M2_3B_020]
MPAANPVIDRVHAVRERIAEACRRAGRNPDDVDLLAVSKTRPASDVRAAFSAGIRRFGENYVGEAVAKQDELDADGIEWHFIGPVQSNKTRTLSERFDWVQSVDRAKIVNRLADQRPADLDPLNVLLQVNIDREPQKSGCDPDDTPMLADAIAERPELRLRGVMAIPAADRSEAETRASFAALRAIHRRLRTAHPHVDTLSMGMSADLEAAIAEGATMVRIGTAVFGPRDA